MSITNSEGFVAALDWHVGASPRHVQELWILQQACTHAAKPNSTIRLVIMLNNGEFGWGRDDVTFLMYIPS